MKPSYLFSLFLMMLFCFSGCNVNLNKSIHIGDGETVYSSLNAVNGSIIIGSDCKIEGDCRSVNGRIEVGSNTEVEKLQTVNGGIEIGREVIVHDDLESINGSLDCKTGVNIHGDISTINGSIDLQNTIVERNITTYNGNITLSEKSILYGDIIVKRSKSSSDNIRRLKIQVTGESVVEGDIIVRDRDIDVQVNLSHGGKVNGKIENAEVLNEEI